MRNFSTAGAVAFGVLSAFAIPFFAQDASAPADAGKTKDGKAKEGKGGPGRAAPAPAKPIRPVLLGCPRPGPMEESTWETLPATRDIGS